MAFYRGFKAEAERLALSTRKELGLGPYERLDPHALAQFLSVPVLSLREIADQRGGTDIQEAIRLLQGIERSALSAFTIFWGSERAIVHNDAHPLGRQASNITHELAHGLRLHPPAPLLDRMGCRNWNADYEDEANFLGGALLIPGKAAHWIARRGFTLEQAALDFGCSVDMVRWRINITGAKRLLAS